MFGESASYYLETAEKMVEIILGRVRRGARPRFRFGPAGVVIINGLSEMKPRICLDDDARSLVDELIEGTGNTASMHLLTSIFEIFELPFVRGTLDELGLCDGGAIPPDEIDGMIRQLDEIAKGGRPS